MVVLLTAGGQQAAAFSHVLQTSHVHELPGHRRSPRETHRNIQMAVPAQSNTLLAGLAKGVITRMTPSPMEAEIVARLW